MIPFGAFSLPIVKRLSPPLALITGASSAGVRSTSSSTSESSVSYADEARILPIDEKGAEAVDNLSIGIGLWAAEKGGGGRR